MNEKHYQYQSNSYRTGKKSPIWSKLSPNIEQPTDQKLQKYYQTNQKKKSSPSTGKYLHNIRNYEKLTKVQHKSSYNPNPLINQIKVEGPTIQDKRRHTHINKITYNKPTTIINSTIYKFSNPQIN